MPIRTLPHYTDRVSATLRLWRNRLETTLAGAPTGVVRHNMYTELWVSVAYGIFFASAVSFLPVILRRMGASTEMLAIYTSQLFVGSALASLSIVIMRRRRTMNFIVVCWVLARSMFLLMAFVSQAAWMIVLSGVFWLLEVFPSPGYTRILQTIYPAPVRGKIMSTVRLGRVGAILVVTPLAGWALDQWGYRLLFPLAGLVGIGAALFFLRVQADEGELPARQTRALSDLVDIVKQDRRFSAYLISFAILGAGTLLSWPLYPVVQVDTLELSYSEIGLLGMAQSTFWLLGYLDRGRQVDRRGGLWVLRVTAAVNILVPFTYMFAETGWMLLPAFIAQGISMAGWDMGAINAGIQLAKPDQVTEYAAIQSTAIGVRGIITPLIGAAMLWAGVPMGGIFIASTLLIGVAWWLFGRIHVVEPGDAGFEEKARLRYRWPLRARTPRY